MSAKWNEFENKIDWINNNKSHSMENVMSVMKRIDVSFIRFASIISSLQTDRRLSGSMKA